MDNVYSYTEALKHTGVGKTERCESRSEISITEHLSGQARRAAPGTRELWAKRRSVSVSVSA